MIKRSTQVRDKIYQKNEKYVIALRIEKLKRQPGDLRHSCDTRTSVFCK